MIEPNAELTVEWYPMNFWDPRTYFFKMTVPGPDRTIYIGLPEAKSLIADLQAFVDGATSE